VPSELRLDPFTGAHTLIATGRASIGASRPGGLPSGGARCPFCPGHEADTEDTIWASGDPWDVRVVLNRFPLVDDTRAAGRHELVIESRAHDQDLVDLPVDALASLLSVYQSRVRALEAIPGIASVVLFRNRGRRAGSSQAHPHAQIVALPIVPPAVHVRDAIALAAPDLLARVIAEERGAGLRIVSDEHGWVTFCPHASSRAHEVRIAPDFHCERFSALQASRLPGLAQHLSRALRSLRQRMGLEDYNLLLRDPAIPTRGTFFSFEILPRTGGDAGFELGSGVSVCVVSPEETAAALRALSVR
jgi:UDPglucose--hexose-1-phosphate uridylyltransferase